jgi:hypothetical protein
MGLLYVSDSVSRSKVQKCPCEVEKRILKLPVYFNQRLTEVFVPSPGPSRAVLCAGKIFFGVLIKGRLAKNICKYREV